ncbi:uncharacterized protein LOC117769834 [Hippoglossus hippoglossus]|uniref:uncharacterized protein LOC117769834 n=1 Tax=Hippoglossus hippoglossus TaxID=8267 RepID=UPI00148E3073|nr:uncharacterized protein LOC117769834 [Hippoglossus hippoglossus]
MLILFQLLLLLGATRSAFDQIFETKTVDVGDDVKLTCSRQKSIFTSPKLFWIRLVSGNLPEFLGGTHSHDHPSVKKTPHFTVKQEPGSFVLYINKTEPSDAGVYYCIEQETLDMKLLNGTFLKIKGPEPDITAVIQVPPSDTVSSGDSVTLQCSVLSDSDNHTCPRYDKLYWFRADESHPSLVYVHGSSGDECDRSLEAHSPHRCVFNFCKSFSSSDFGTYYCAVVTCGEILFGQGIKLENEALNIWTVQKANTVLCLLSATLAISLIVIVVLIQEKMCDCCKAGVSLQTEAAAVGGNPPSQQLPQRHEDSLFYSTATFTRRKAGKITGRRISFMA